MSPDPALRPGPPAGLDPERLRAALGADAVACHAPRELDGAAPALSLRPASGEALAAALRLASEAGAALLVRGGGTRLGVGNPPRRADAWLCTDALAGIAELDAEEGVALARAGTPLGELAAAAGEAGWELPLESPGAEATVGGTVASAAAGPRLLGFGPARAHVLGLRVAHADGGRARCGGRVVKNVTGFDLMKLHAGAFGTLGVIEEAWLRLRPRPEAREALLAWLPAGEEGLARGAAAARLGSARAVALVDPALASRVRRGGPEKGRCLLVAELAGPAALVARDRQHLAAEQGAEPAGEDPLPALAGLLRHPDGRSGLRLVVSVRPARLAAAALRLTRAGASLVAWPGGGAAPSRLVAGFPLYEGADEAAVDAAVRAGREAARAGGGACVLEAAPAWAKSGRDVFGDPPDALALMRALKQRFDPGGLLNPGRFVGGL